VQAERWKKIEDLYEAALAQPPERRADFINRARPSDPQLCAEVESLLNAAQEATDFLGGSPGSWIGPETGPGEDDSKATEPVPDATAGTVIGRYRLLARIGEGGMGEVWLAEQKEPVRRQVALKLVKAGMNSREVIARFESERQALALMDHPGIAKVFDAGSASGGAPYFVMEYVAGVPITTYCDRHRLSTPERLELFMQVCEAVQHAHQKAIIHRDLKPSNILVTEVDRHPVPKIIDFGVAKALTQKLAGETMFTRAGVLIGTPEYMSPEQANSSGQDIDTRTDVYSLGIVLYELLAGVPPLDLRGLALDEFLRRLRDDEPPRPSTQVRAQDPTTAVELAGRRRTEPLALSNQLRGDLDSIALRALEKDRSRRYGSPSDLAADIGRYLRNETVLAVPVSVGYAARKFARRHRGVLVTSGAFVLVLILAAAVSIWQSIRATRQRGRADAEAATAQAVRDFLQHDLLAQASAREQSRPSTKPDPDLRVRTALDRAAVRIAGKFDRQPEVEAAIRDTMGQTYMDLGLYPEARTQLERALQLHRRMLGAEDPTTVQTMSLLGRTAERQGKFAEAEALHRQTLEIQRRVLGPENPNTLSSMADLAADCHSQGKYGEAETLHRQALEIRRRVLGPEHPDTLASASSVANDYYFRNEFAQAEALQSQTLEIRRRVLGPEHPDTLGSMGNLAMVYDAQGKRAQSEALYSQSLEIQRRVLGPEHPSTLVSASNLAEAYGARGNYAQAEELFAQTLKIQRRVLGPEHINTLVSMANLAFNYSAQGKNAQAQELFARTLEIMRRVLGTEHLYTLDTLVEFAFMYQRQGKYDLAETYAAQVLAGRRHILGPEKPDTIASMADLALAYQSQRKFAQSEPLAREAVDKDRKIQPDDWQRFRAESLLGASLAGQKKFAEAESLLLAGYQGMLARKERIPAPDQYHLDLARKWLAQLYQAWGKPEKAAEWRQK